MDNNDLMGFCLNFEVSNLAFRVLFFISQKYPNKEGYNLEGIFNCSNENLNKAVRELVDLGLLKAKNND